jgi:D-alanyl-D-alanine carboxypeptidase
VKLLTRKAILLLGALLWSGPALPGPAMLVDAESGLVLYAEDADRPWQPASLTKLMTAFLVFEAIRDGQLSPDDLLTPSETALAQEPSKIGLPLGAQIRVEVGLKALIVKSANDVAVMFAEQLSGSVPAFVDRMNDRARRLGMTSTRFVNPSGLPIRPATPNEPVPVAVTTARDMAILARALLREFPHHSELYALPAFKLGNRFMRSHNSLLRTYDGADGMKTGFICASGYNVVASATRNGQQLIAVVLGAASGGARALRAASLFEHGFVIYPWKTLFSPTLATLSVTTTADAASPPDLRPIVCRGGGGKSKPKAKPRPKPAAAAEKAKN